MLYAMKLVLQNMANWMQVRTNNECLRLWITLTHNIHHCGVPACSQ